MSVSAVVNGTTPARAASSWRGSPPTTRAPQHSNRPWALARSSSLRSAARSAREWVIRRSKTAGVPQANPKPGAAPPPTNSPGGENRLAVRAEGSYETLTPVQGYWASAEAIERQRFDRWLRTVRVTVDQEPRQKGRAGRREAQPFRAAVREAITLKRDWPKPRAALALDFAFQATARQPPSLWRLPKHYLDLLGASSAPTADPGPVLYGDDQQVKLLFATLYRRDNPGESGRIHLEARTRASAITDMQLAGELIEHHEDLEDDTRWAEADPEDDMDQHNENRHLPEDLAERLRFHDKARCQAMLLGSNDRLVRDVFFHAAGWLLTGVDSNARRLERLGPIRSVAVEDLLNNIVELNGQQRDLLWSTIRVELPPLPLETGDGVTFALAIRRAFRGFIQQRPDLQPLIVPLRVTVLVVPPKRRAADIKDLDNILINVLAIMEEEVKPHPEPWHLAPPAVWPDRDTDDVSRSEDRDRSRGLDISGTWTYQVLELHRQPADTDQGALVLVPGLGWNRMSIWSEAERFVEQRLADR